jgi:hypothetical protein
MKPSPPPRISDQNHSGIIGFQRLFEPESRKKDAAGLCVGGAFSNQLLRNANHQPARMRLVSRQMGRGLGQTDPGKEQGRRRSIPPTALPAPDIEIGLRRPVDRTMLRNLTAICELVHNRQKNCGQSLGDVGFPAGAARSGSNDRVARGRRLLLLAVGIELLEKGHQVVGFLLVHQAGIDHLGARDFRFRILDVLAEGGFVPGDPGVLVGGRI